MAKSHAPGPNIRGGFISRDAALVHLIGKGFHIIERIGDGPALITGGQGGYEEIPRPNQKPILEWSEHPLKRMSLPLMIDGWPNTSVQKRVNAILDLGTPDGDDPPPVFTVTGPIPYSGERFVLESTPDFTITERASDGRLIRQGLTLALVEFTRADAIKIKKRKSAGPQNYTVKKGETYRDIAHKLAPKSASAEEIAKYAKQIAKANGDKDIRKVLNEGKEIKVPDFDG